MADIFISYTSTDREWAFWIAAELKALGHAPHVHEWEIDAGADIYAWMEERHDAAEHVLCVISDEYLKAPYSTLERNAALWQAIGKRPGFALLVVVRPCRLPTLADHIRRCELFGIPQEAARLRFREFMQHRAPAERAAFPGKVSAVSNIPIRVPEHFLGRDDDLLVIEKALARYEGRVAITALHGMRGIGKTTLAAAFAERHRNDYRATWWIRAQSEMTIRADLMALGVRLAWVESDDEQEGALAAVAERLRHEGEGILLVYDNAVDARSVERYLPRGGAAKVLITSNAHAWRGVAEPVEVLLWPTTIGADYLIARTDRAAEREAAQALSQMLGGLPLAHEQAAAYCERLRVSLAEYARRFTKAPTRLLDEARYAVGAYHDGLTVAKAFTLAIEEAAKADPAAAPLLLHAALLAAEPVPLFLFADAAEKFAEPLACVLGADGLDEAIAALTDFALIERDTIAYDRDGAVTTEAIRLHRLVREVAVGRCEVAAQEAARFALLGALAKLYPNDGYNNPGSWPRCAALTPHLLEICESDFADETAVKIRGALFALAGVYFHGRADYSSVRLLFERALAIGEKLQGPEHPDTATSLNNLAVQLQAQGDLAGARPLYERALAIREKAQGPDHPETARSLVNLAALLQARATLRRRGRCSNARSKSSTRFPVTPIWQRASATSPSCCRPTATLRGRGRSMSGHSRSASARKVQITPRRQRA